MIMYFNDFMPQKQRYIHIKRRDGYPYSNA